MAAPPLSRAPSRVPSAVGRRVLGAVLVLLWVAFVALATANQLRVVSPDRFSDDLAAGRVVTWRIITLDGSSVGRGWVSFPNYGVPAARQDGEVDHDQPMLPGREALAYFVDSPLSRMRVVDPHRAPSSEAVARLREAGVRPALGQPELAEIARGPDDVSGLPALALGLVFLGAVLVGPVPTRGTRWFWFWQGSVTLGAGVLAYAVLEGLRPAAPSPSEAVAADADPPSAESPTRQRGWVGLVVAILGSLVLSAALTGLADGTHWLWVVRP
ncbi:hypothetical protein [Phycicoccus sonneratiae]|uniref:DUF3592 domain-containing protein n=1 Tax=Phycicoccus sonneratiae TaxID=2807628 RepID=A0ABS2CRQ7_9MICO|nr:hypothetical protein [Phycicoccus sonneraticus]MBM6402557.1 hypothetical protein [Phycicoccus sonneraticus]